VLAVRGVYADVGKGQKGGAVYKTMDEVDNCWGAGRARSLMALKEFVAGFSGTRGFLGLFRRHVVFYVMYLRLRLTKEKRSKLNGKKGMFRVLSPLTKFGNRLRRQMFFFPLKHFLFDHPCWQKDPFPIPNLC